MTKYDPLTVKDLQDLIDARVPESIHLDYKHSAALTNAKWRSEITKDVSSFANADGGTIIYGIAESPTGEPESIDEGLSPAVVSKEQIEAVILANISPRPTGIAVTEISLANGNRAYSVRVQKSMRPLQDRASFRYYKRFNFKAEPMEDFEIEDLRLRAISAGTLIRVKVVLEQRFLVLLKIENTGKSLAKNVTLSFHPPLPWHRGPPKAIRDGLRFLSPGEHLTFSLGTTTQILRPDGGFPPQFEVTAKYVDDGVATSVEETFYVDWESWMGAHAPITDQERMGEKIVDAIKQSTAETKQLAQSIKCLEKLVAPTGLALSVTTLRNFEELIRNGRIKPRLDAEIREIGPYAIKEALGVDMSKARRIWQFLDYPVEGETLEKIFQDDPDLVARIKSVFM